jgi:hypothetical protein
VRNIAIAVVVVPLAIPAFLFSFYLKLLTLYQVDLDQKLIDLINKLPG